MTDIYEDCPHRQQLEHTLRHCQTQSEILQATRDNYLSIIEEFQRDLEELTEQVEQQQQQQQEQQHYELLSKETKESPEICTNDLEQQNEVMDCQMYKLRNDLNETIKLKSEEVFLLKKINSELSQKVTSQLKAQEIERQKLCTKYDDLVNSFEEQGSELKNAKRKVQNLEARLTQNEKQHEEFRTERNLLCEEIVSLKEKLAQSAGRERALNDQLKLQQQDYDKTRCLAGEMRVQINEVRSRQKMIDRLCLANEETRKELRNEHDKCKEMQNKITQQTNVIEQLNKIIDSFRQWKGAQVRSDEAMRQRVKRNEEQIYALINENHRLCNEYRNLHRDNCILETEFRRLREAVDGCQSSTNFELPNAIVQRGQQVNDNMNARLMAMCQATQRLTEQNRALNDGSNSQTSYQSTQDDRHPI